MASTRAQLERFLKKYVSNTFDYIKTINSFVSISDKWDKARREDIETIRAMVECDDDECEKLCSIVRKQVRSGIQEVEDVLEAMEKLAVTSVLVFRDNEAFQLTGTADLEPVCTSVAVAQILSPLLILFQETNEVLFKHKLQNTDILLMQLKNYIETVKNICLGWRASSLTELSLKRPEVEVKGDQSETALENLLSHIRKLDRIRMDEDFRMMFLFQGREQPFMIEYSKLKPEMLKVLDVIEGCADHIVSTTKKTTTAGVAISSAAITGGVLSILALILAPFTLGASAALAAAGLTVGVASAAGSIATTASEMTINKAQVDKAEENFKQFVTDADTIQSHLDKVIQDHFDEFNDKNFAYGAKLALKGVRELELLTKSVLALRNVKAFTAGALTAEALKKGFIVAGKLGKGLAGAAGALFIGIDIYYIVKGSMALKAGGETQASKWIRARVDLWRGQVGVWQRIWKSLKNGQQDFVKNKDFLTKPF